MPFGVAAARRPKKRMSSNVSKLKREALLEELRQLRAYLDAHGFQGGIVRNDETTDELCICTQRYCEDIASADWQVLSECLP